jgi:hypothetical protein
LARGARDFLQLVVGPVLEDAFVVLLEGALEQRLLALDLGVGIEHQHLAAGLGGFR